VARPGREGLGVILLRLVQLELGRLVRRTELLVMACAAGLIGASPGLAAPWILRYDAPAGGIDVVGILERARHGAFGLVAILVVAAAFAFAAALRTEMEGGQWRLLRQAVAPGTLLLGKALGIALCALLVLAFGMLGLSTVSAFLRRSVAVDAVEAAVAACAAAGAISCGMAFAVTRVRGGVAATLFRLAIPAWLIAPLGAAWLVADGTAAERLAHLGDGAAALVTLEGLLPAAARVGSPAKVLGAMLAAHGVVAVGTWLAIVARGPEES
jgi:hypothetical protein